MKQAFESVASREAAQDFSSTEVIPVRIDDSRIYMRFSGAQCWHMQSCDGPTILVVGPEAPDDSLGLMASRFGIPLQTLVDLRAAQTMRSAS